MDILLVAVGGGCGAAARYIISNWLAGRYGAGFPYGTLLVNIIGCFIIGAFMTMATERLAISSYWRLLIVVGFVGGLTTFSSFSYETLHLLVEHNIALAVANIGLNVLVGFTAAFLGITTARLI